MIPIARGQLMTSAMMARTLVAILVLLGLSACSTQKIMRTNEEMRSGMKTDPAQIKEDLKPRIEESKKQGPVVQETLPETLKNQRRELVNQLPGVGPEQVEELASAADRSARINVNLVDADLRQVAQMFTEVSGINFVVSSEVNVLVTVRLKSVLWDSALDNILKMHGLGRVHDRRGNVIRIHKQETLVAREEFDRKRAEDLRRAADAQRTIESMDTEIFRLFYTKPDKIKATLDASMNPPPTASGGGAAAAGAGAATPPVPGPTTVVDMRTNSIIVKGTRRELDAIARLIERLDTRTRQILVEAFIVEVSDDFSEEFGARLGYMKQQTLGTRMTQTTGGTLGTTAAGTAANVPSDMSFATNSGLVSNLAAATPLGSLGVLLGTVKGSWQLKAELSAMEKLGLSKVISNPRIFTMDNEEASITDGKQVAYPVAGAGANQITYEFKDAALKLTVTPSIVGDGNILLNVLVAKDTPDTTTTPPAINKKEVKSKMLVKDGAIAVIGGIYSQDQTESTDKVPGLGNIPGLGILFRHNTTKNKRTELLIFLSPSVI